MLAGFRTTIENERTSIEDDPRNSLPKEATKEKKVDAVRHILEKSQRITVRMIADELNISECSVHKILTEDLVKRNVCARFVPHFLTEDQKAQCIDALKDLIEMAESDEDFLHSIVTGDESWCYEYNPSTKR